MENSSVAGTLAYLLISVLGLAASRALARYCSGPRAVTKWYYVGLAFSIAGCAAHWSVFKEGKILFYDQPGAIFKTSGAIRWIAFASALLQACCIPTSKEPKPGRRWGKFDPNLPLLQPCSHESTRGRRARCRLLALKIALAVCLLALTVAIFKAAIADPEHRFDGIMTQVLAGGSIPALDALLVAVELVIEQGSLSADHSLHVLA